MRITTILVATALTLSIAGHALAQGAPGGGGSGGNEQSESDKNKSGGK